MVSTRGRQTIQKAWAPVAALGIMVACGVPSEAPPPAVPAPRRAEPTEDAPSPEPVVSSSPREQALARELRRDVDKLAGEIGERNVGHVWELADAADYLATELENAGYSIERQGFLVENGTVPVQNLSVTVRGGQHSDEIVVVAAHYDTPPGSRGRDDNASGAASLLALARAFRGARPARTLRLVLLVNEEAPFAGTEEMGSVRYANHLAVQGEKVAAAIALRALGAPSATQAAADSSRAASDPGVTLAAPPWAEPLAVRVTQLLSPSVNVSVVAQSALQDRATEARGAWGFWRARYPAVLITGRGARTSDDAEHPEAEQPVDYEVAARRVRAIEIALEELLRAGQGSVSTVLD